MRRLARHPDRVLVGARGCSRPMSPRTSIGFGMSRWLTIRWRTTTSAESIAAAVPSLSPTGHTKTTLFGAFSWSCGAPGWVAFSASTTAGSGSHSTWIASSASRAWAAVSAMTAATPSPVHLTLSVARARGVLTLFWMPADAAGRPGHRERVVGHVGAGQDQDHAGHRLRRARVDRADVGVGVGAAQDRHVGHPGQRDVVEVAALAGDEPGILDPLDRGAEHVGGHRMPPVTRSPAAGAPAPARVVAAASRMAATMLW